MLEKLDAFFSKFNGIIGVVLSHFCVQNIESGNCIIAIFDAVIAGVLLYLAFNRGGDNV